MTDNTSVDPIAGQLWDHAEHDYTIVTTRVTNDYVHYKFWDEEPRTHANRAQDLLEEQFGYSLAYIAPEGGSCLPPDEFEQQFEYQQERPRESYESDSETTETGNSAE